jgi:hypothetical protein
MKKEKHPSDSTEQRLAHKEILALINQSYKLNLVVNTLYLADTSFQIDGYSENPPILCEIYSRIGQMKVAQHNKIAKDILKMLLIEKMAGKQYRKIITFADEEAAQPFLDGESWYSKLKENFEIEIIIIQIPEELRNKILDAQKRQYR